MTDSAVAWATADGGDKMFKTLFVLVTMATTVTIPGLNETASSTIVSTTTQLQAAIDGSNGGTIELAPGEYGGFEVAGKQPASPIVITSQSTTQPAVIRGSVHIDESRAIQLARLRIDPSSVDEFDQWDQAILVRDSTEVQINDLVVDGHIVQSGEGTAPSDIAPGDDPPEAIVGYAFGTGIAVRYSSDVALARIQLRDLAVGAFFQNTERIEASALDVHDIRKDGIDLEDLRDATIEHSKFETFLPWTNTDQSDSDHPDMIQYWGANGDWGIDGLTIRDNFFLQGDGEYTQTIFGNLSGGDPDSVRFRNFDIFDNLVINSHVFGIHLGNTTDSEIHNNLLLPSHGYPGSSPNDGIPRIGLSQAVPASSDNRVHSNILVRAWWQDDAADYFGDALQTNSIGDNSMLEEVGQTGSFTTVFPRVYDAYDALPNLALGRTDLIDGDHGPSWLWAAGTPFDDLGGSVFTGDVGWMYASGITAGCTPTSFCPDASVTRGQMAAFFTRALGLPAAPSAGFTDTATSVFSDDIDRMAASGITNGCRGHSYCPDAPVTRGQMAAFFTRALNLEAGGGSGFTDIGASIFAGDIERLAAAKITQGCTPTLFCPDDSITRGQMAAFFHRASTNPNWPDSSSN